MSTKDEKPRDEKRMLEMRLTSAVNEKSLDKLHAVAQDIFEAGYELEEMKVSKLTIIEAMGNLASSGWVPDITKTYN